jgi:hypothetical protein
MPAAFEFTFIAAVVALFLAPTLPARLFGLRRFRAGAIDKMPLARRAA